MSRPEHVAPADLFYDEDGASKYTGASRVQEIQTTMAERCLELLNFADKQPQLVLDIGCGSGISSDVLAEAGNVFVGLDISTAMLDIAVERDCLDAGELMVNDIGAGFGFRPGVFDGAISVSVLQWLCYSDKKDHRSVKRLEVFFTSLYRALRRGARAALQIYPENAGQLELITTIAMRCGFTGGLVVDFPNSTKARKYYLCLFAGVDASRAAADMPAALDQGTGSVAGSSVGTGDPAVRARHARGRPTKKEGVRRNWVLAKKDARRRRGVETRPDSKYTGRKRKAR